MNTNISSLKTIVEALQKNDYVTSVTPVTEDGKEVGYTITFSKSGAITIYHGKDGADGTPGADGEDGTDGQTPVIGVRQDVDEVYYWTLNGEWLLDDSGNKIPTTGKDGADGEDGQDGITPQLKIEDGYWYVSYDNGASWTEVGKAVGENGKDGEDGADGDSFFRSVTQDDANVYFTLADGTVITLPKKVSLSIEFDSEDLVVMAPNSTRDIRYTVTSVLSDVEVEALSSGDVQAKVVPDETGESTGVIRVRIPGDSIDEYCKVVVLVSNGEKVIMRTLTFEEEAIEVVDEAKVTANAEGGEVELLYLSNVECEVVIPEDAKSWISVAPATKALQQRSVSLVLQPNTEYYRSATVTIKAIDGSLALEYVIEQDGDLGVNIDPTQIPDNEIWYTTTNNAIIDLESSSSTYNAKPFDVNVVSHTYQKGIGVIKCDGAIKVINDHVFGNSWFDNINNLYLPNSITTLKTGALRGIGVSELRIPDHLQAVGCYALNSEHIKRFTGNHTSADGRCVIIEDGFMPDYGDTQTPVKNYMAAFAPAGITEYTLPNNVEILGWYTFAWCTELRKITFNEGLKTIMGDCFMGTQLDCEIILPSTLESLDSYAFHSCSGIKGFYGNEKFHSSDHLCLIFEQTAYCDQPEKNGKWINRFVGYDITDYSIPEGIKGIENYSFDHMPNLKTVTLPSSIVEVGAYAFNHCDNIEALYGECVSDDHKAIIFDTQFRKLVITKDVVNYSIPDDITSIGYCAFTESPEIETITMGDQITHIEGYAFSYCPNLKTITLSAGLKDLSGYNAFLNSEKLESIYCRALVPPSYYDDQMSEFPNLKFYVPEQSLSLYQNHAGWSPFKKYFVGYKYDDLPDIDYYISSDYTADGVVTTLQTATVGDGIDIVLMGDAYSDRQIADGTYKADMEYIYNNLFTEEPYRSFKDYFNVHYVNVVSATEGYEYGNTALDTFFGDGTYVGGSDNACFEYALNAISENDMDEALIIVAMNSDNYAGTCYMYYPTYATGTYGSGPSVAYFPKGGDQETFAQLLHHEACGHGFAKLADEYAYEDMGTVPGDYATQTARQQNEWGWWKNVDFTNEPSQVRWSYFLEDERYQYDGLGCFEGGLTYWNGVWRPTENSIMRYNTGGFNAPSREAIYYRIHKLAYGDSWEYDYEDFVEYDAVNRASSASAPQKSRGNYVERTFEPTAPPVVVNKSWREAK